MNAKIALFFFLLLTNTVIVSAQVISFPPLNLYQTTLSLSQLTDSIASHLSSTDTMEGGSRDQFTEFNQFWQKRVVSNDSTADSATHTNMFSQYFSALYSAALARTTSSGCGTSGFQGDWQLLGPTTLPIQAIGRVDALWVDPSNSNHVMAGTIGGLFETQNANPTTGQPSWHCLTNGTILNAGIMGITCITVDPLNSQHIYLGTSGTRQFVESTVLNIASTYGAGILESTDGGSTWSQETLPIDLVTPLNNNISSVQKVYISPDHNTLYALSNGTVWFRSLTGTTWNNITPPTSLLPSYIPAGNTLYYAYSMVFINDPSNPGHFFLTATATDAASNLGNERASIYESKVPRPASTDWSRITSNFQYDFNISTTYHEQDMYLMTCSAYSNDYLYVMGILNGGSSAGLFKYPINTSGATWTTINPGISPDGGGAGKFSFAVTAPCSDNMNNPNFYFGANDLFQSYDGGNNFVGIGDYSGYPTHGDIRDIKVAQTGTSGAHGLNDLIYIATDGGVSEKPSGVNPDNAVSPYTSLLAAYCTTKDVSGNGLTCGEFWGIATTEAGGLAAGGMQHDGQMAYEPTANPPWINLGVEDAYSAIFDHDNPAKAYMTTGIGSTVNDWDHFETYSGGGRQLDGLQYQSYPSKIGNIPIMTMDNTSHHHIGLTSVWLYDPNYSTYNPSPTPTFNNSNWWEDPLSLPAGYSGLPTAASSTTLIQCVAFSPDIYNNGPTGYVVYQNNGGQAVYKRSSTAISTTGFSDVTSNFSATYYTINDIAIDPGNTDRVWIAHGGINYSTDPRGRVHYSPNGSNTWYDISYGLPSAMPVSCIVYDSLANALYCATDVGIYKCDFNSFDATSTPVNGVNQSVQWTCFSKGVSGGPDFPNAIVTHLEINRCQGKLFASTYGRAIWTTDLYDPTTLPPTGDVISTNTTWGSSLTYQERYIRGCITVNAGKTLTILNSAIHMPKDGQILVEPGGRLVVNGSTLTNDCQGCMWFGIRVLGNSIQPQNTGYQGSVNIINNSIIENARFAVVAQNSTDNSQNGGIIQARNSIFYNNARSAVFESYHNIQGGIEYPNVSSFSNCQFTIDNNYKGDQFSYPFVCMSSLWDVQGVQFSSCQFTNTNTNTTDEGIGIGSYDAGYTVSVYCNAPSPTTPCPTTPRSTFSGFGTGINIDGDINTNHTIFVDRADFSSNSVGIFVNAVPNVSMTNNGFTIGGGHYIYDIQTPGTYCHQNIGIYCKNTYQFKQEANVFTGSTSAANSVYTDWTNFGSVVENSAPTPSAIQPGDNVSTFDNQVYRSQFNNLNFACYAIGNNGGTAFWTDYGLSFLCNTYKNNSYDIYQTSLPPAGIRPTQGSLYASTGNTFVGSSNPPHIINNGNAFQYWYSGSGVTYGPSTNVSFVHTGTSSECASTFNPWGQLGIAVQNHNNSSLTAFSTSKASLSSDIATLNALMDKGNTDSIISIINTTADPTVMNTLMTGIAPFTSQNALLALSNTSALSRSQYISILDANPEALRDDNFLNTLSTSSSYPLSSSDISSLQSVSTSVLTGRTNLQCTVNDDHTLMSLAANELLINMKSAVDSTDSVGIRGTDSTTIYYGLDSIASYENMSNYATWLQGVGSLWAQSELLGYYSNVTPGSSTANADSALSHMGTYINTTDSIGYKSYSDYQALWSVLKSERLAGTPITAIPSTDSSTLAGFASFSTPSTASAIAYSALNVATLTGIKLVPLGPVYPISACFFPLGGRQMPTGVSNTINPLNSVRSKCKVSVFPNPTNDIVTFQYQLGNTDGTVLLKITNALGMLIKQQTVIGNSGSISVDLSHFANTFYVFSITDDNGIIANGKVVKD